MTQQDWHADTSGGASATPRLSIILPCFNEEKNIELIHKAITQNCPNITLEILFVDDGSFDNTNEAIHLLTLRDPTVKLLRFVRNAGHQNAIRAGYRAARGEFVVTMDSDLQHPPEAIPSMLAKALEGFDVVQMVRSGNQRGFVKNILSRSFYKIFNSLSDVPIIEQASDFRLISRYTCDVLNSLPERNLMVRAILPYLGFRTATLPYSLADRLHGKPGFSFQKSMKMGSQAFFNFSTFPLKLAMRLGFFISTLAFGYGIYNVAAKFFSNHNVPGYTDLIASTLFLGGLILLYLGILGRYILIILDHLKRRPEYLIADELSQNRNKPPTLPESRIESRPESRPQGRRFI